MPVEIQKVVALRVSERKLKCCRKCLTQDEYPMCVRVPNVTQPLLYLEDAPVSCAQTHGGNPGLADSMALAHKAVRFPETPYLKLLHGFSWISFHKQNQSVRKRLLCEDPIKTSQ